MKYFSSINRKHSMFRALKFWVYKKRIKLSYLLKALNLKQRKDPADSQKFFPSRFFTLLTTFAIFNTLIPSYLEKQANNNTNTDL